jgi:hypothetical protein
MNFDITHEGRTTFSVDRESALALGYPVEAVDEAERNVRIRLVKFECRRRIYSEASAETQMNMATAAAVISAKEASARTEDEASILSGLDDAIGWVAQMRARVTELADDAALDIGDDANWPPLPDGARDVVAKF